MSQLNRRDRKTLKRVRQVFIAWSCTPERWEKCGDSFCKMGREQFQWFREKLEEVATNRQNKRDARKRQCRKCREKAENAVSAARRRVK